MDAVLRNIALNNNEYNLYMAVSWVSNWPVLYARYYFDDMTQQQVTLALIFA
jgi:glucose-6-phosphate-specific signal transduction histidine kinase